MPTEFTINLTLAARRWYGTGQGPGDWFVNTSINTHNPQGWNISVDNGDTPTRARISSPLDIDEFILGASYVQNGFSINPATGYGTEVVPGGGPYLVEVFSTTTENIPIGSEGATLPGGRLFQGYFNVISYGPLALPEQVDVDKFDEGDSQIGRRQIVSDGEVLVDRLGSPVTFLWELRTDDPFVPSVLIQSETTSHFEMNDELEPGNNYELKLTVTNNFGKVGWSRLFPVGESIAAQYDRTTGMVRVLYGRNQLRCATYAQPQPIELDNSHPTVSTVFLNTAPHAVYRYGAEVYAVTSAALVSTSRTEGATWLPNNTFNGRCYGHTLTPDGSTYSRVYGSPSDANIWFRGAGAAGQLTTGLEGFKRPSVMLNIGTGYILIAKLGNDVVCAGSQDGVTWEGSGVVSPDSRLLGAFKTADHSIVSVMVLPRDGVPELVRLFYSETGWDIQSANVVSGLPVTLRTPAALDSDGIRTVLVYTDGDGHGMATSDDLGITWTIED